MSQTDNEICDRLSQQQQEEIAHLRAQLVDQQQQNTKLRAQNALLIQQHHQERMRWIGSVGSLDSKMDTLLDSHNTSTRQIREQVQELSEKLTIHPSESKTQGFAIMICEHEEDELKELQFISGQIRYANAKLRDRRILETVVPFTPVPSGVNLRNRVAESLGPLVSPIALPSQLLVLYITLTFIYATYILQLTFNCAGWHIRVYAPICHVFE